MIKLRKVQGFLASNVPADVDKRVYESRLPPAWLACLPVSRQITLIMIINNNIIIITTSRIITIAIIIIIIIIIAILLLFLFLWQAAWPSSACASW